MKWLIFLIPIYLNSVDYTESEEIYIATLPEVHVTPEEPEEKDIILLAKLIQSEARNEPFLGQLAVGQVVLNRMKRKKASLRTVIFQKGQFDGVNTRQFRQKPDKSAYKAARLVLLGRKVIPDTVEFYHNPVTSTDRGWTRYIERYTWADIGNHRFCLNPNRVKA